MDCSQFDEQVVRLEKISDIADEFIRVRLAAIEPLDLKIFDFDHDLTFMVIFMNADQRVYSRYGGRCEKGPDERQSLAGLRHAMESVLAEHRSAKPRFAPRQSGKPFFIREIASPRDLGRCVHCHQAKEVVYDQMDRDGTWNMDLAFRYPLPENLGIRLDPDKGAIVKAVDAASPAEVAGIKKGDRLRELNGVPVHAFGDVSFALDRAPKTGRIRVSWQRDSGIMDSRISLPDRWRRTDISWRPSLQKFVATCRLYGKDLKPAERFRRFPLHAKRCLEGPNASVQCLVCRPIPEVRPIDSTQQAEFQFLKFRI